MALILVVRARVVCGAEATLGFRLAEIHYRSLSSICHLTRVVAS